MANMATASHMFFFSSVRPAGHLMLDLQQHTVQDHHRQRQRERIARALPMRGSHSCTSLHVVWRTQAHAGLQWGDKDEG